jgi:hypothetical protein
MTWNQLFKPFSQDNVPAKGKKRAVIVAFSLLVAIILISGCTDSTTLGTSSTDKYGVPVNSDSDMPPDYSVESFMDVGQKVKIWYLQHSSWNNYQVGLRGSDKQLQWYYVNPEAVYLEEDIETSYIERLADKKNAFGSEPAYVLHTKVGTPIQGGKVSSGKTTTDTNMIVGGDTW